MATSKKSETVELAVSAPGTGTMKVAILGSTPYIAHRLAPEQRQELVLPRGTKLTSVEKQAKPKHDIIKEFRNSWYEDRNPHGPTLIQYPGASFKRAMMDAALDMPEVKKAQVGRLCWVNGERLPIWGVQQIMCAEVVLSGVSRSTDIRTRAIIPEWATLLHITYVAPRLNPDAIMALLVAAGITCGVGDWRQQKGSANYGSFTVVGTDDPTWNRIIETGGRSVQMAASANPIAYNEDTEELVEWYLGEAGRRKLNVAKIGDAA